MHEEKHYPRPPLVLIVASDEWLSLSVETLFSPRGYAVLRALSGAQALDRIRQVSPDLLVVAKDLRDCRGVDLCRRARALGSSTATLPIVLISPTAWTRKERMSALRAGSWDAVSFPIDGEELFLKVDNWVHARIAADVARERGLLDEATGFYNTQGLLRRIAELAAGAGRHGRPLACVIVSTDEGGAVVDLQSSETPTRSSDSAVTFAETLRAAGRASDTIGRLSESEFVVVAPDTDTEGALALAQRLKKAVESSSEVQSSRVHLRFGCYAVPDFRAASIAPTEMLIRAGVALRSADADANPIRFFDRDVDYRN